MNFCGLPSLKPLGRPRYEVRRAGLNPKKPRKWVYGLPKPPKVCKIMANDGPKPVIMAIKAIILQTFGVQVGCRGSMAEPLHLLPKCGLR